MSLYLQRKKMAKIMFIKLASAIAVIATILFLANFLVFVKNLPKEKNTPVLQNNQFDGIITYTGGQYRLGTTSLIIKNGFKGPVLISGVNPNTNIEKILNNLGLNSNQQLQINIDYNAMSTAGNVQQTINWVKSNNLSKVLIITSYYHIPRTLKLLNKKMQNKVSFIAYPVFSNNANFRLLLVEYIKFLLFKFNSIINISLNKQF